MKIIGFELRNRRFKYCRCDEFGTRLHGRGASGSVRITPLGRELVLSKELRCITLTYYEIPGIHEWDAYRQHLPSIRAHVATISAALERYQARRAERGVFQLVPVATNSPWFRMPSPLLDALPRPARAQALRRCRARRQERKAAAGGVLVARFGFGEKGGDYFKC